MRYLLFFLVCLFTITPLQAEFPTKPIKFVVYTNPGGLIDVSARKLAGILEEDKIGQPVIVENKKGAGGLVAIQHVLRQPADGHTVFALTSSVISKAVETGNVKRLEDLEMFARLVEDYECLIVREGGKFNNLQELVADLQGDKKSIWVGPAVGGTDHLFALKFWNAAKGSSKWIPYKSGSEAIAALMGGHGDVYVGNPQDILGREGLKIIAVASPERIQKFKDAPTFEELGYGSLTGESLWRGLALHKDTPGEVKAELLEALKKASQNEDWKSFVTAGGAISIFETGEEFSEVVSEQIAAENKLLKAIRNS